MTRRERRYKKAKRRRLIIFMCTALACILGVFICLSHEAFDDDSSFESFSDKEFKEFYSDGGVRTGYKTEKITEYDKDGSVAVYYPVTGNRAADRQIEGYVKSLKEEPGRYRDEDHEKNDSTAHITRYRVYESSEEVISILFCTEEVRTRSAGRVEKTDREIKCMNLSGKSGSLLNSSDVFVPQQKDMIPEIIVKDLTDEYGDDLKEDHETLIAKVDDHPDDFVITEDGVLFAFDAGVLTDDRNILTVRITREEAPGLFRDKIGARVIDPEKPMVALTFDDGPDPIYTPRILNTLIENGSAGTFYLLGRNMKNTEGTKDMVEKMIGSGSEIGSHSYDHPDLLSLTDKEVAEQNRKTDEIFMDIMGEVPATYRPPYGNGNDRITEIFDKAGILWSIDTLDWKSRDTQSIVKSVMNVDDLNGHVVLMHSIYKPSADAADILIPLLVSKGYQLVTVSELMQYKYNIDSSEPGYYGYGYFKTIKGKVIKSRS